MQEASSPKLKHQESIGSEIDLILMLLPFVMTI